MQKIEGYILKPDTFNRNGYAYAKDCKISYPEKVPITLGFEPDRREQIVGEGKLIEKEDGVYIEGEITDTIFNNELLTHMGLYATNVNKDENGVVKEMTIREVGLLTEIQASMPECKIERKVEE